MQIEGYKPVLAQPGPACRMAKAGCIRDEETAYVVARTAVSIGKALANSSKGIAPRLLLTDISFTAYRTSARLILRIFRFDAPRSPRLEGDVQQLWAFQAY